MGNKEYLIPYIPTNTGVILAYNEKETDKLIASGKARLVADGIYADLGGYMVLANLNDNDANYTTDEKVQTALSKNMLRPTTYTKDGNTTNGNFLLEASTFKEGTTNTIAYRNYNFTFYKKKGETNYKLGFYRIKNKSDKNPGLTTPSRAYLQLAGEVSGGTTPTTDWDDAISFTKSDAMAKAQIFNAFVVDYPDWDDDIITGIQEIKEAASATKVLTANSPVYDIAGRKVATCGELSNGYVQLPKGLYIMNGKKVIIR